MIEATEEVGLGIVGIVAEERDDSAGGAEGGDGDGGVDAVGEVVRVVVGGDELAAVLGGEGGSGHAVVKDVGGEAGALDEPLKAANLIGKWSEGVWVR